MLATSVSSNLAESLASKFSFMGRLNWVRRKTTRFLCKLIVIVSHGWFCRIFAPRFFYFWIRNPILGFLFCGTFYLMGYFTFRDERSRRLGVGETSTHRESLSLASMGCSGQASNVSMASLSPILLTLRGSFCADAANKGHANVFRFVYLPAA